MFLIAIASWVGNGNDCALLGDVQRRFECSIVLVTLTVVDIRETL